MSTKTLNGKVALVTGGSKGIGAAICQRLAADGALVLVNYSSSADAAKAVVKKIQQEGGHAAVIGGDLSDLKQLRTVFATIDREHTGKIDILVNNAGVYKTAPTLEFTEEDYEKSFAINVHAVFEATRESVRRMGKGGRVITIGSVAGERGMGAGMAVYCATKFAVAGMTRSWAHEFAPLGITANIVQPGPINTDMNPADTKVNPAAEFMAQMVPMKRYGTVDEVAATVAFLASPEASYVNGTTLTVDGGLIA